MKNKIIALIVFTFGIFNCIAQIPVMSPITGPSVVCSAPAAPQNYITFATNSPTSYSWSVASPTPGVIIGSPANDSTSISFPQSNATYTVYCSATNGFGTSATTSFVVNVFQTPSVTFSGANSFCSGSNTILQASSTILPGSSTISYNWTPAAGISPPNGATVTASPSVTTTYTVVGTIGSCTNASQITVSVHPNPTINASINPTLTCTGDSFTLTIQGSGTSYSLNGVSTPTYVVITPSVSDTYVINAVNAFGCASSQTLTQTIDPCVGIKSISESQKIYLSAYPNPNSGSFKIRSDHAQTINITNELGQKVRTISIGPDNETHVTGLTPGVYFISSSTAKIKIVVIQ